MAKTRLDFQALLKTITTNVYFQQPSTTNMQYPAIVYSLKSINNTKANNRIYGTSNVYDVKVIDKNPDSVIATTLMGLDFCTFDRQYVADGLNHTAFVIYF